MAREINTRCNLVNSVAAMLSTELLRASAIGTAPDWSACYKVSRRQSLGLAWKAKRADAKQHPPASKAESRDCALRPSFAYARRQARA